MFILSRGDMVKLEKSHNISLPKWANESVYERLGQLWAEQYKLQAFTPEMQRLKAGTFLNVMLQRMLGKSNKSINERMKFYVYSSIMSAVGVWNGVRPTYATALIFELEERKPNDFVVRVLYKNSSMSNTKVGQQLHLLRVPGCSVDCPLQTFEKIIAPMLMTGDWREECNCVPRYRVRKIALTLIIFTMVLGVAVVLYIFHKRRQTQDVQYERSFENYGSSATDIL
ncbi:hypothetical protein LSAT2_032157 [Lamellibrachia satsuma]|nr:hypothetical protein LSAT2_032157 [Lamellibrachia satsuma]